MAEVLVKIVIELLSILAIATKEVNRRRASEFFEQDQVHSSHFFSRDICSETTREDRYRGRAEEAT